MDIANLYEIKRMLLAAGYEKIRDGKHEIWYNGKNRIAVPKHDLKPIISHKIMKQCGLGN